jgi:peptidoglycan/xylan/chitin deacetylase (PgdA/CDA1 family)
MASPTPATPNSFRALTIIVACAIVAACPLVVLGNAGASNSLGVSAAKSPVTLSDAAYSQSLKSLEFTLKSDVALDGKAAGTSDGTTLCWTLAYDSGKKDTRQICVKRDGSAWWITKRATGVRASVSGRDAKLTINPQAAGLRAGIFNWSASIDPADCALPTGNTGATAAAKLTRSLSADCAYKTPTTGSFKDRIKQLQAVGCVNSGAKQVTSGPRGKRIAVTFDDGPSAYTPSFLKMLKKLNMHATFFMIGQQVAGHGPLLKQMLADGHELANHSWNHANLGGGGPSAGAQITNTNAAIERASGFKPCLFRPPGGSTGADLVARAHAAGDTTVLWSVDPDDWKTPGTPAIVSRVLEQTKPGAIILDHDGGGNRSQTLAAVPQYIKVLKKRGYKFVTVSELLHQKTTYRLVK